MIFVDAGSSNVAFCDTMISGSNIVIFLLTTYSYLNLVLETPNSTILVSSPLSLSFLKYLYDSIKLSTLPVVLFTFTVYTCGLILLYFSLT